MNKYRMIGAALIATVFATIAYSQQSNIGGLAARLRLTSLGVGATPPAAGNITASGTITGASIAGAGSALTALNASNLSSGTVPDARFPATLPAASGANLTSLNASNLSSGTVADARLATKFAFGAFIGGCVSTTTPVTTWGQTRNTPSCASTGTGAATVTLSAGFTATPLCMGTGVSTTAEVTVMVVPTSTTTIDVRMYQNGVLGGSVFSVYCIGT